MGTFSSSLYVGTTMASSSGPSGQEYYISREASGAEVRFCTTMVGATPTQTISTSTVAGGCVDGSW